MSQCYLVIRLKSLVVLHVGVHRDHRVDAGVIHSRQIPDCVVAEVIQREHLTRGMKRVCKLCEEAAVSGAIIIGRGAIVRLKATPCVAGTQYRGDGVGDSVLCSFVHWIGAEGG